MHKKITILTLSFLFIMTSVLSGGLDSQAKENSDSVITSYVNQWAVIPEAEQQPEMDGHLDDPLWEEAGILSDFKTAYYNETIQEDLDAKLAYDEDHLYIGLDYTSEDVGESLANFDIIISPDTERYFRIPVKMKDLDVPYVNDWGVATETVEDVQIETITGDQGVTAEIAIPLEALEVDEVIPGDEWKFNAIVQHELGTKPLSSWVPIRKSTNWYNGGASAKLEANVIDEDRLGSIFMGNLSTEGEDTFTPWEPEQLTFAYQGFTEKQLFLSSDLMTEESTIQLNWKAPSESWESIDDLQIEKGEDNAEITFSHPEPLRSGLYQLQILIDKENGEQAKYTIVTFDRHSLISAGDSTFASDTSTDEEITEVSLEEPSENVERLLEIIPEKTGFRFTGLPDRPELHPDKLFEWSSDDPWTLTSKFSDLTYPNEEYPEDQVMTAKNKKGETVEYPYYEDEDGKRYFLSAHIWHYQRDYVSGELKKIANNDPLGAARLLYRFAQAYEGWVPTNEYPWHNQPLAITSGPPYTYWGGMWTRWSTSDLGSNFRHVLDAYEIVKETNALEALSQEVGEDVEQKIIQDMLEPSIDYYRSFPIHYNNMEYHNALGLIDTGKVLEDPSYIHETVEWAENFMTNTYLFDGFFKETTISYHAQSTGGINSVLNELEGWSDPSGYISPRSGTTLENLDMGNTYPVLKKAVDIPNLLVYPDGKHFPTQDTWASAKASNPILDAGSFLLPASGIARMARGIPEGGGSHLGIKYDFPALDIVEQSVGHQDISGTLQLEANEADHHITFAFDVPKTGLYEIDLQPFHAASYGRYNVLIDDEKVTMVDFYSLSTGPQDFEELVTMELTEGEHQITFQNVGKDPESTNYKMGIIQLALLDEAAQKERDEIELVEGDPMQVYLTFQPRYGHHHLDPLNLTLYANDQELLPDIGYTHTFYGRWTNSALGHNTVVVDGQDMTTSGPARDGGNIDVFASDNEQVQVTRASQEAAYAQTDEYSREPWMIQFPDTENNEGYVLDLFRVSGGDRHEYTLQGDANHDATFETDLELTDYGPYLLPEGVEVREPETELDYGDAEGHYYGYIYVRDVKQTLIEDGQYDMTLVTEDEGQEKGKMKITGLVEPGQNELFLGESPSLRATRLHGTSMDTNDEAVKYTMPKMVLRREGTDLKSEFITAMEPYTNDSNPRIESIEKLEMDQSVEGDLAVKVTYGDTTDIVLSSLDPDQPLTVGDMTLQGKMGMIRLKDGEVEALHLVGGTLLKKGDVEMTEEGSVTGKITEVHRQAAGDGQNAFITDAEVPANTEGNTLVITHPDGKTYGYEVAEVSTENGKTVINIGDMDPGFVVNDDNTSALQFYPFTEWEGATTFRIENGVQASVEREVNVGTLQQLVEALEDDGEFEGERAVHALTIHLEAIVHFEKQEAADKVVKHMNGFHQLLNHQKESEFISEKAYQVLKRDTEILIEQWQS